MKTKSIHITLKAMMLQICSVIVVIVASTPLSLGQDALFSQFYAAPLYLNPALAGLESNMHFGINHRTVMRNTGTPGQVSLASFIKPLMSQAGNYDNHIGGVSAMVYNETSGKGYEFRTTGLNLGAAYNVYLDKEGIQMIAFGLQGGVFQKSLNLNGLSWGSQYNEYLGYDSNIAPSLSIDKASKFYPVVNAGVSWFHNPNTRRKQHVVTVKSFAGFSVSNINSPYESMIGKTMRLPRIYRLHGGMELISIKSDISVSPNALIIHRNDITMVNFGMYFNYRLKSMGDKNYKFSVGNWYRFNGAFITTAGLSSDAFSVALSYDSDVTTFRNNIKGGSAIEMSLSYEISKNRKIKKFSTPLF